VLLLLATSYYLAYPFTLEQLLKKENINRNVIHIHKLENNNDTFVIFYKDYSSKKSTIGVGIATKKNIRWNWVDSGEDFYTNSNKFSAASVPIKVTEDTTINVIYGLINNPNITKIVAKSMKDSETFTAEIIPGNYTSTWFIAGRGTLSEYNYIGFSEDNKIIYEIK
jgi:hypothetical protein